MIERLLTESGNAGKISLGAAAGNADSASVTGLPGIHETESGDHSRVTAIPAAGWSRQHKISSCSMSPTNTVTANGAVGFEYYWGGINSGWVFAGYVIPLITSFVVA